MTVISEERDTIEMALDHFRNPNRYEAPRAYSACRLIAKLLEDNRRLQSFKDYVHTRLDEMAIEKDPPSIHRDAGCRIGGRLDLVQDYLRDLSFIIPVVTGEDSPYIEERTITIAAQLTAGHDGIEAIRRARRQSTTAALMEPVLS